MHWQFIHSAGLSALIGARVDLCSVPAACSTVFNPDTMTFDPAFANYNTAHATVSDDGYAGNPAALYMVTSRLQGETEHITAILKGTTEQLHSRHAAIMKSSNRQVARCYQTKVLTTFQETSNERVFQDP